MKLLGIDYGRKKVGLAISEGLISEPLKVIRYQKENELFRKLKNVVQSENVEIIIIGLSEGKMAEETKIFGRKLKEKLKLSVVFQDESLSTQIAQQLSISANIKRQKRKKMEDAYSASVILQSYLDTND